MKRLAFPPLPALNSPLSAVPGALGFAILLVAALDAVVILLTIDQDIPLPLGAAVHLAVAGLAYWLVAKRLAEPAFGLLLGVWTSLLGPLGALMAGGAFAWASKARSASLIDEPWLRRLSSQTSDDDALVAALRDRRAYHARGAQVQSFAAVMKHGSVTEKQIILGLIAKSYERAFHGLLMEALRSHEVAVRASAAAVLAKLRDRQVTELKRATALADSGDPDSMIEAARIKVAAAHSGLMTEADAKTVLAEAAALRHGLSQKTVVPLAAARLAPKDPSSTRGERHQPSLRGRLTVDRGPEAAAAERQP
jgi:hypothetical protein